MTTQSEVEKEHWISLGAEIYINDVVPSDPIGDMCSPDRAKRAVECVNALRGVASKYLQSGGVVVHIDLTREGETNYVMTGTKDDIILFAEELLRDEGYSVFEPGEDTFFEE